MSNKSIRMLVSVSLNVLIIVLGIYLVFFMGSKAYSFGEKIFNEQAVDSDDNARTVEVTITTDIQAKKLAGMLYDKPAIWPRTKRTTTKAAVQLFTAVQRLFLVLCRIL